MSTAPQPITSQTDPMVSAFAGKIRAKFPGAYDDLKDDELATKIVSKHPEYADMLPKGYGQAPQKAAPTYSNGQQFHPGDQQFEKGGPIYNQATQLKSDQSAFSRGETLQPLQGESPEQYQKRGIQASNSVSDAQRGANISSEKTKNIQDLPRNIGNTAMAASLPLLPASLAEAPAATALGIGGSVVGGKLGQVGVKALGGGETAQDWGGLSGSVIGGLGGGLFGDRIVPSRAGIGAKVFTPEGKLSPIGEAIAHPIDKAGEFGLRKLFPPPQPEGVGATLPSAGEFYENKGEALLARQKAQDALERQDMANRSIRNANDPMQQKGDMLMKRGAQQAALDRAAARAIPKPQNGVMSIGEGNGNTLSSVARPQVGLPQGESTPFQQPSVRMVSKFEPPEAPPTPAVPPKGTMSLQGGTLSNQPAGELPKLQPINRTVGGATSTGPEIKMVGETPRTVPTRPQPRSIILPGEEVDPMKVKSAGSAAQATAEDLYRLSEVGDKSATDELIRRRLPIKRGQPTDFSRFPLPKGGQ